MRGEARHDEPVIMSFSWANVSALLWKRSVFPSYIASHYYGEWGRTLTKALSLLSEREISIMIGRMINFVEHFLRIIGTL